MFFTPRPTAKIAFFLSNTKFIEVFYIQSRYIHKKVPCHNSNMELFCEWFNFIMAWER